MYGRFFFWLIGIFFILKVEYTRSCDNLLAINKKYLMRLFIVLIEFINLIL